MVSFDASALSILIFKGSGVPLDFDSSEEIVGRLGLGQLAK